MISYGFLFCCLIAATRAIDFNSCGGGDIDSVDVSSCTNEPCTFRKGSDVEVQVSLKSNIAARRLRLSITAMVSGVDAPFPGLQTNACNGMGITCPVSEGDNIVFKYSLKVQSFFPSITTDATFKVYDGSNVLFCFKVPVEVSD